MSKDLVQTVLEAIRAKPSDVERHIYLVTLSQRNAPLFFKALLTYPDDLLPLVYTPVVGYACQNFSHIFPAATSDGRGLFISINDKGRIRDLLRSYQRDVKAIVVSDGERILGLGDLGANGMGIPIGKLALYSALAGVDPTVTLPVILDVGTEREEFRQDPLYIGLRQKRVRGEEYYAFVDEFITAADEVFDHPLIQFEDFGNTTAFKLLQKYEKVICTFNDDIQGTASVVLGGVLAALRITKQKLQEQTFLFYGAGEAGCGVAELLASAAARESGESIEEARKRCWLVDSQGLIYKGRPSQRELAHHKIPFAHELEGAQPEKDLVKIVKKLKPTAIFGLAAAGGKPFNKQVIGAMTELNERPIIFALSNPTHKSECTAQEAYEFSGGKAIFASGSPFDAVEYQGKKLIPGQGNNSYIFPGVGLGVVFSRATRIDEDMFHVAASELAALVTDEDLAASNVYPPLSKIRTVSLNIAAAVVRLALKKGVARIPDPGDDLVDQLRRAQYVPTLQQCKL